MKLIQELKNKRILLVGFAREGVSSLNFLRRHFSKSRIGIFDQKTRLDLDKKAQKIINKEQNLILFLTQKDFNDLINISRDFDIIIKSAGIPNKLLPEEIINKVTTQTAIFFDNFPGLIIGVTGTKGKSTTSSLIYQIIKTSGKKTILLGNIGAPCLDYIDKIDKDRVFIVGDNKAESIDSRQFGWIGINYIVGKVIGAEVAN